MNIQARPSTVIAMTALFEFVVDLVSEWLHLVVELVARLIRSLFRKIWDLVSALFRWPLRRSPKQDLSSPGDSRPAGRHAA
jgi:hypothetical protein